MTDTQRLLITMLASTALGSCSHGRPPAHGGEVLCGTPAVAAKLKSNDAETIGECPSDLSWFDAGARMPEAEFAALWNGLKDSSVGPLSSDGVFHEAASERSVIDGVPETCCYRFSYMRKGRPLVVDDRAVVARAVAGSGWHAPCEPLGTTLPHAIRRKIAGEWLDDALAEHASVASFARATLETMAVGVPAVLLAEIQRAALDEIEHARICFALAAAYGVIRRPGPLPPVSPRAPDLARLAVDTFVEACVSETTAALLAERCAAGCEIAPVQQALRTIAADEARHAALGWRTLAWLFELDTSMFDRTRALAAEMRPPPPAPESPAPDDAILRVQGRPSARDRASAGFDAFTGVIEPMLEALARPTSATAARSTAPGAARRAARTPARATAPARARGSRP